MKKTYYTPKFNLNGINNSINKKLISINQLVHIVSIKEQNSK